MPDCTIGVERTLSSIQGDQFDCLLERPKLDHHGLEWHSSARVNMANQAVMETVIRLHHAPMRVYPLKKRDAMLVHRGIDLTWDPFLHVEQLLMAYTCAKPPSTNNSVPVM